MPPSKTEEKKLLEDHIKTRNRLLFLITTKKSRQDYLAATVKILQRSLNCQCVGIRVLDEKGNVPYDSYCGFSKKFWEKENNLSTKNDHCACTRVITGKIENQDKKNITPYGSFNCPNIKNFVSTLTPQQLSRFRGTCVKEGFLSLAIIPIKYHTKTVGAIHLADRLPHKISPFNLHLVETIAPVIAEIIQKFNIEDDLKKNYDLQYVLTSLLNLSLKNISLDSLLSESLQIILSVPWLAFGSTGSIFLTKENEETLEMISQKGLARPLQKVCQEVDFGKCLCGLAAKKQKIIFADYLSPHHTIKHKNMTPHGHYCVPIVSHDKTLGVLNIYTEFQHKNNNREETFLISVANTLAGIIERKKSQIALKNSTRALEALSACNRTLIHAVNEGELLKNICRIIVEIGGYKMAWVGAKELDAEKRVSTIAQYGFENGYLEKARVSWDKNNPRGNGPTGRAIRTGKIIIGENFKTDTKLSPWKKEAHQRGFKSSIALPLKLNKETFGAITIYSGELNYFDKKEIQLLSELAADLSFGIHTLRLKKVHEEAEKERKDAEQKLLESYKYLGTINRQISILLDLNKNKGQKDNSEIMQYIINSAINLSQAKIVSLYKYNSAKNNLQLLFSSSHTSLKNISINKFTLLYALVRNCCRVQGTKEDAVISEIASSDNLQYFLFLPLSVDHTIKGALFLGFSDREFVTSQELDFYEAFAAQSSLILQNLNILQ